MDPSEDTLSSDLYTSRFTSISDLDDASVSEQIQSEQIQQNIKTRSEDINLDILFETQKRIDESDDAILKECFSDQEFMDLFGGYKSLALLLTQHSDMNQLQSIQEIIAKQKSNLQQTKVANESFSILSLIPNRRILDKNIIFSVKKICVDKMTKIYYNANHVVLSIYDVSNDCLQSVFQVYKAYQQKRNKMMIVVLHDIIERLQPNTS